MENIYWNYDAALHAKGNKVILTANNYTNATRLHVAKNESQGVLYYNNKVLADLMTVSNQDPSTWKAEDKKAFEAIRGKSEEEVLLEFLGNQHKSYCKTAEEQRDAAAKGWWPYIPTIDRTIYVSGSDKETAGVDRITLEVTIDDLVFNINNQWADGNGAGNFYSSQVDAVMNTTNSDLLNRIENNWALTGKIAAGKDLTKKESDLLSWLRAVNQQKYKSSTTFLKSYQGTNVSIPIAIKRTFVSDDYDHDIGADLVKVSEWATGIEVSIKDMFSSNINRDEEEGGYNKDIGFRDKKVKLKDGIFKNIAGAAELAGGILQRAPLGYQYDPTNWYRIWGGRYQDAEFPGTIKLELPSGLTIGGLIVYDCTIHMSSSQVLTRHGLRPLTATIMIQLQPARIWGVPDVRRILSFGSVDGA